MQSGTYVPRYLHSVPGRYWTGKIACRICTSVLLTRHKAGEVFLLKVDLLRYVSTSPYLLAIFGKVAHKLFRDTARLRIWSYSALHTVCRCQGTRIGQYGALISPCWPKSSIPLFPSPPFHQCSSFFSQIHSLIAIVLLATLPTPPYLSATSFCAIATILFLFLCFSLVFPIIETSYLSSYVAD